jgi:hypothetical protein
MADEPQVSERRIVPRELQPVEGGPTVAGVVLVDVDSRSVERIGGAASLSMAIPGLVSTAMAAAQASRDVYRMVGSPEVLRGLANGALRLDEAASGGLRGDVRDALGRYAGKVDFEKVDGSALSGASAAVGAMQLVSFAVGQYHLAQITARLSAIDEATVRIEKALSQQDRRVLAEAEDTLRSVLAILDAGEDLSADLTRIDSARRAVIALFEDLVGKLGETIRPLQVFAADERRKALDAERDAVGRARRLLEGERTPRVERTEQWVRGKLRRPDEGRARTDLSDRLDAALEDLRVLERDLAVARDREAAVGEVSREVTKRATSPDTLRSVVEGIEQVTRAAHLAALMVTLSVEAEPTEGRRIAEAAAGRERLRHLSALLDSFPAGIVGDIAAVIDLFDGETKTPWARASESFSQLAVIGELLAAAATDSLALTPGNETDTLVFARLGQETPVGRA